MLFFYVLRVYVILFTGCGFDLEMIAGNAAGLESSFAGANCTFATLYTKYRGVISSYLSDDIHNKNIVSAVSRSINLADLVESSPCTNYKVQIEKNILGGCRPKRVGV